MNDLRITPGGIEVTKNSVMVTMSREAALNAGVIEPTPEELAERNERSRAFHAKQRETRAKALAALAELQAKDGLTTALLALHSCDTEADWGSQCTGCDSSGYESEQPEWPCRTILALAEYHGIDLPDSLPGKHYEGEFVPSDGKVFRYTPRWFEP